jgi:hypothetical protein
LISPRSFADAARGWALGRPVLLDLARTHNPAGQLLGVALLVGATARGFCKTDPESSM